MIGSEIKGGGGGGLDCLDSDTPSLGLVRVDVSRGEEEREEGMTSESLKFGEGQGEVTLEGEWCVGDSKVRGSLLEESREN